MLLKQAALHMRTYRLVITDKMCLTCRLKLGLLSLLMHAISDGVRHTVVVAMTGVHEVQRHKTQAHEAGGIGCEGLYDLSPIRAPSEVVGLHGVDDHGQHLPGHHGCRLGSYGSLDLGVEHNRPVHTTHTWTHSVACYEALHVGQLLVTETQSWRDWADTTQDFGQHSTAQHSTAQHSTAQT